MCLLPRTGQDTQQSPVSSILSAEYVDALLIKAQMFSNCRFRQIITEVKTTHGGFSFLHFKLLSGRLKARRVSVETLSPSVCLWPEGRTCWDFHSSVIAHQHYRSDLWPAGIQTWHTGTLCPRLLLLLSVIVDDAPAGWLQSTDTPLLLWSDPS